MNEVQLYNLHNNASAAGTQARLALNQSTIWMVTHLREDHNMSIRDIAKRLNVPYSEVREMIRTQL